MSSFAKQELNMLIKQNPNHILKDMIPEIERLVDAFHDSGQSGGSAPFVADCLSKTIKKLCTYEPIVPILNIDEEWTNITDISDDPPTYQNKRCSAMFKETKNDKPYYLDAIVWKDEHTTFTGNAVIKRTIGNEVVLETISSRQYIKSFPFTPKTFYVDVDSVEIDVDDWEAFIKDEKQLKEVFDYYDKFNYDGRKNKK